MKQQFELSKENLITWVKNLLPDPFSYQEYTGAAYQKEIREFEYCSRPLWAIFSLMINNHDQYDDIIEPYIKRIKAGLQPNSPYTFPIPTTKTRQIAVEMAVYGYGLLACKNQFLKYLSTEEIHYLENWLNHINEIEFPIGNWLFFLLIVNYGLKENNLHYSQEKIDFALEKIQQLYIGNGWYQDGHYSQRDYYISFAFHFYSLILKKYCSDFPMKVQERSYLFEKDFIYWFDNQGRSLPFGRSLTYRYAHVCYWSACAVTDMHQLDLGYIKAIISNHLNFWFSQKKLNSIGYAYPNLLLSEDYNANGSPMWAMKTFILLSLPDDHKFWKIEEKRNRHLQNIYKSEEPGFLFVTGDFHHYALSANQYSKSSILQHMSKYGKFCYSTAFGWNLSRDVQGIENFAVDSTLALSIKGTNQYVSRGKISEYAIYDDYLYSQWDYGDIAKIKTWLIPVDEQCHIRIHCIDSIYELETYEGAFPVWNWNKKFDDFKAISNGLEIKKGKMLSAIVDLYNNRKSKVVTQNPNTNIYSCEKNAIPTLHGFIQKGMYACVVYGSICNEINYRDIKIKGNKVYIEHKSIEIKEL